MGLSLLLSLSMLAVPVAAPTPVRVAAVRASSALPAWKGYTFGADNLIDGRVDTSWQPAKSDTLGVGQWIELDLGAAHTLSRIEIEQGLQKVDPKLGDLYCRNNRFAEALMFFDDGTFTPVLVDPDENPVKVEVFFRGEAAPGHEAVTVTRYIRLVIRTVQEPVDWKDLAIAELRVFGTPASAPASDAASVACDGRGAWPLKAAVTNWCATTLDARARRDCPALVRAFASAAPTTEATRRCHPSTRRRSRRARSHRRFGSTGPSTGSSWRARPMAPGR